jgi:hypothetical protein
MRRDWRILISFDVKDMWLEPYELKTEGEEVAPFYLLAGCGSTCLYTSTWELG